MMKYSLIAFLATFWGLASAFVTPNAARSATVAVSMAPKYDKKAGRWEITSPEEGPEGGYGPAKTLLIGGPKPFISRVATPDDYEQAVLKFMAGEKCSREVAQGNMDRYLENAQDWAFERFECEKKGRPYPQYHIVKTKQIALTLVWAGIVAVVGGRAAFSLATGTYYWSFLSSQ
mmetsp:Transcript_29571/g.61834  ORF Transcript_29571/g.61834 Transcript_29571/m.61834 type:complete len:175 (-) Transcript_29571:198-722(-)